MSIHLPSGEVHTITNPCKVRGLWPLPRGILLETSQSGVQDAPALIIHKQPSTTFPPYPDGDSASFVLMQPLEDFMPVDFTDPERRMGRLLLSIWQRPLLLDFDQERKAHTIWVLQRDAGWQASVSWKQAGGSVTREAASSFCSCCEGSSLLLFLLQATTTPNLPLTRPGQAQLSLPSLPDMHCRPSSKSSSFTILYQMAAHPWRR